MFSAAKTSGPSGYNLTNSLRFRASASASLTRTPTLAGNTKTFTISAWLKRGSLTTTQAIITQGSGNRDIVRIGSDNLLYFYYYDGSTYITTNTSQVFRDPSAWYHIVIAVDTTQATAANRIRMYVNGNQITAFANANYPSQNYNFIYWNTTAPAAIGKDVTSNSDYLDGYLADFNFIDGQALTPSSFGSTNSTTGVWQPAKYTGTYGTNGFYLNFSNIALTSGSNTGLGKDNSGNGNYWNTNNISVTSGTTYDAMTDVPTNTSATVANYATLNPLLQNGWWAAPNRGTIQDGNLTFATGGNTTAFSNFDLVGNSGKWYYEMTCSATDAANAIVISAQSRSTFEVSYYQSGQKQINSATPAAYGSSWTSGDVIGVAIDVPNNNITFYKNNTSQGVINNAFPTGQPVYVGAYYNTSSGSYAFNFGQRPFSYTPPSGYVAMNTYNLPTPTILQGNKYMDATLYTGNGSTQVVVNQAQFKPDFVWMKNRTIAQIHGLFDSVRGAGNLLSSDQTTAETAGAAGVSSFNSNGFGVGNVFNNNTNSFVGWQWQAGQGSTSSNTSGSITSTVSVNTTAGFSVVTYTGTGANATVGHGLGVAPKMVITKQRNTTRSWYVYHASLASAANYLVLDSTAAAGSDTTLWNNTAPTSSVFSLGANIGGNQSTGTYVAYCWAAIPGFSAFGSYTGNGSADGPFVFTNFQPTFVMCKRTDGISNWNIVDNKRPVYNPENEILLANDSSAALTSYPVDFLSNGFKMRNTEGGFNTSGGTYIYAAFASNPFKNSLAR